MGIVRRMQNLLRFLMEKRQSGSTFLLNKIAKENDVYVLVHKLDMVEIFDEEVKNKIYSPETVHKLEGAPKKPILIDNALFHEVLRDALLDIGSKEEIINHQEDTLRMISRIIVESKKTSPHQGRRFRFQKNNNTVTYF